MSNQDGLDWGVGVERRALLERLLGGGLATAIGGGLGLFGADLSAAGQAASSPAVPGIALTRGVRRVITGHNDKGKSYIIRDDRITTGAFPSLYKATGDQPLGPGPAGEPKALMSTDAPQLEPSLGGSSFHFVTLPPTPKGAKP